jgi:hypothetical protein
MEDVGPEKRHLVAAGLMSAFKKIWVDAWSARMEYILGNVILALLEYPDATLLSINRMLTDKDYRKAVVVNITDPSTKAFWTDEFAKYTDRYTQEATPAIQNKVGQFTANPLIRNIVGQSKSSFDIRKLMDEKKILIINLSKGQIGEGNANLLGSMLITKIYLAAMSRADTPEAQLQKLPNFYLYVDEFQSFANESFADILSEARKYKLNLTIAHQYIEQMSDEVRSAVFGNVGTMVAFRVGAFDAEVLEKEFSPVFTAEDLVNLGFAQIYLKLMIDGIGSHPFSATTLPPIAPPEKSLRNEVIENSRKLFAQPKSEVEEKIKEWYKPVALSPKEPIKTTEKKREPFRKENEARPPKKPLWRKEFISRERTTRVPARQSQQSRTPRREVAPMSLDALKKNSHKFSPISSRLSLGADNKKDNKGPTPEKMKSLKEALSEALKEKQEKKINSPNSIPNPTPISTPAPKKENTIPSRSASTEVQKEVSEETLKKILE